VNKSSLPRRSILKLSLALSGLLLLDGLAKFLGYNEPTTTAARTVLNAPESYTLGMVTGIPEVRCWLLRDEGGLYALSSECTHLGCLIKHSNAGFACPCHGSQFDLKGQVTSGPAVQPLRYVELSRSAENLLVVDASVEVTAGQRLDVDQW